MNAMNLYSAALSVMATFPGTESRVCVAILGLLGTLAASANILDSFLAFLFCLSIAFAPVAGVVVVDYALLRRGAYVYDSSSSSHDSAAADRSAARPTALLAWMSGATVAALSSSGFVRLTGVAALDALVASAASYYAMSRCGR